MHCRLHHSNIFKSLELKSRSLSLSLVVSLPLFLYLSNSICFTLGTGTNACYLEKEEKVGTIARTQEPVEGGAEGGAENHIIINTEWGAFGDQGELDFIRTKWDHQIDEESLNPGKQTFEKMIR